MPNEEQFDTALAGLTADIVSAFVSNSSIQAGGLPELISDVHRALQRIGKPAAPAAVEKPVPAVPIKKSITLDYLISLEDGRQYKSLKRHLNRLGLTPAAYRTKWAAGRLPHGGACLCCEAL